MTTRRRAHVIVLISLDELKKVVVTHIACIVRFFRFGLPISDRRIPRGPNWILFPPVVSQNLLKSFSLLL